MTNESKGVETARRAWGASCRAWSQCDHLDNIEAMKLGEAMMYAATDYICALDEALDRARNLSSALKVYGYPVSDAHWASASEAMSVEARGLHLAAKAFVA